MNCCDIDILSLFQLIYQSYCNHIVSSRSEVLERGVKQLISQALESKAKSFQTRIEGVVQNYIYTQHHQQNQEKQNRRHKASDEKADMSAKSSTSEAKQNVVNDITRLIPVPPAGEIGIKTDGHASFKGKAAVQEVGKSGMSSKSAVQPKRTTHGLPTAPTGREGRNVGSPLFVEKDNISPSENVRVQDEKSRSSRFAVENVGPSETSNGNEHRVKALDEVNSKMESEETNSSKSNEKPETTASFPNVKSADKVEPVKKVGGLWVAHTIPIQEAVDVPITVIKSELKTATEEINDPPIHIDKFVKDVDAGDDEKNKTEVCQDDAVGENNSVSTTDGKLVDTVEERIEESTVHSSGEIVMDELHAKNPVVTVDSSSPVCSAQGQTLVRAEGQSLSPVCEEHVKTDAAVSDEPSLFVSTKEDWERVSSTGDVSDVDSDISEVSSVHTSDLSSFDEEVSSASYDDDDIGEQKGEAAVSNENTNMETDQIPAQGQQHPDAPTRRRSTRISSRRSTKEEEEDEDGRGNDGQMKEKSRDSPRRKRRGRRRRRESDPRMSAEGQRESSPAIKRRRGRPRKNERRISSSSENQRRHSRWHSHGESSSATTERSSGHNKESNRRKRSQRQIKRTRCYSPSSEGTREVFLPCKRSRVGSKD